jgi:hypothetical protein
LKFSVSLANASSPEAISLMNALALFYRMSIYVESETTSMHTGFSLGTKEGELEKEEVGIFLLGGGGASLEGVPCEGCCGSLLRPQGWLQY